jgi:ABC-2 type transport system permease protein
MNMTRLLAMIQKEFIQTLRDPRSVVIVLIGPLLYLLLFGFIGTDVRNVPLAVWDQDNSAASRQLLDAYRTSDYFTLSDYVGSEAELRRLIDGGEARAGLIIPPGYANTLASGQTAQVSFIIDGSDTSVAGTALSAAQTVAQSLSTNLLEEKAAASGEISQTALPIDVETQVWYNPDLISVYNMIPALIGLVIQTFASTLPAFAVVRERERGTIEQLLVTPLTSLELMIAKLAPALVLGLVCAVETLLLGVLIFGVPINGSLLLLMSLVILFLTASLGIGLFFSAGAHTEQEAEQSLDLLTLPSIFLSGFLFPLAALPRWLQYLSYLIPLKYFLVITRGIILKGVGVQALWTDVVALAIFTVLIMAAAARRFRKSLD